MSKLAYEIEPLNQVLDGHEIRKEDALRLLSNFEDTSDLVFKTSEKLRDRNKGRAVSFSKKSFFNIINLCRDTCSYCTYKSEPNESKISMLSPDTVSYTHLTLPTILLV